MAKAFIGDTGYKMIIGNTKIRRGYLGNVLVYSGDINVTYHIDDSRGIVYTEPVEEGTTCLLPYSFNPNGLRAGYNFLGWRLDTQASSDILKVLAAGSENMDLYAVYYKDFTVNFYNASTTPYTKRYRMYVNNNNSAYPKTTTTESTLKDVAGFNIKLGWSDNINNYSIQKYNSGAEIQVKSNMNLYSIYSTTVNITIYNSNGSGGVAKTPYSGIRYRQYNNIKTYTNNPQVELVHVPLSGWTNGGWSIDGDATKKINDGNLIISDIYDNKSITALYEQAVVITAYNANNHKNIFNLTRKAVCTESKFNIIDPTINLNHETYSGWTNAGWNMVAEDVNKFVNDGTFVVTPEYDGKYLFSLYEQKVTISITNANNITTSHDLKRYIQFNGATPYILNPSITLKHTSLAGWANAGWNNIKDSVTKLFNDGKFTITSNYDGMSLYALYSKAVTVTEFNADSAKTVHSLMRFVQYNGTTYTVDPFITLSHTIIAGWTNAGWNMTLNNPSKVFDDGKVIITSEYDGKTFYALYSRAVNVTVVNGNNVTKSYNLTRYNQYNGTTYTANPTVTLTHTTISGWDNAGWNMVTNNVTKTVNEGTLVITPEYDGKTFFALYNKNVVVKSINANNVATTYNLTRKVQYNGTTYTVNPTITLKHTTISGWNNDGWNLTIRDVTSTVNDGTVTITSDYDGKTFYALYKRLFNFVVINSNNGKSSYVLTRKVQYNGTTYTVNPTITLKHNTISGWNNAGWNMTVNNIYKLIDDGVLTVTPEYDNKSVYAIYSKPVTLKTVNGNNVENTYNLTRYVQYNGNTYTANPTVILIHTVIDGWTSAGWSLTAGSLTKDVDDGSLTVTTTYDNKTLYALYDKAVSVTVVNANNVSTTYDLVRKAQYNGNTYIVDPVVALAHDTLSGWDNAGWSIIKNDVGRVLNDGNVTITSDYDGKSFYALYSKAVSVTVVNANNKKTKYSLIRVVQYNGTTYTANPNIMLSHTVVSGWTNAGWNIVVGSVTKTLNDGAVTISSSYDNKSIYALYSKAVTITTINGNNTSKVYNLTRYMQYNGNTYTADPNITLSHDPITGWTSAGWNITTKNITKSIDDGAFTVTSAYDNKSLYSIYAKAITVTVYNAKNSKSVNNLTRYTQYYGTAYTVDPTLTLTHDTLSGWTNAGWNITTKNITKTINDGNLKITSSYDGKSIYAIYSQAVKLYVVNGASGGGVKTSYNKTRYVQYYGSTYTVNPTISLNHTGIGGWTKNGWNFGADNQTPVVNTDSSSFSITSAYDNKTLYALYMKDICVSWKVTADADPSDEYKERYARATDGSWAYTDPIFKRKIDPVSGWDIIGWTTSNKAVTTPTYNDNQSFTTTKDMTLYSVYRKTVTLTVIAYNTIYQSFDQYRYTNWGTGDNILPKFSVDSPTFSNKTFIGWSVDGTTTVVYQQFTNVTVPDSTRIYAVWRQNDIILKDYTHEPNGYKSFYVEGIPETYRAKIYREVIAEVDTNWFDTATLDIRVDIENGKWATATWCFVSLFEGNVPDMLNPHIDGQPDHSNLRAINWWSSGGIQTDDGPCAGMRRATVITARLIPTPGRDSISEISYVYTDDWYKDSARFDIWTIVANGKTRVW